MVRSVDYTAMFTKLVLKLYKKLTNYKLFFFAF